MQYVGTAELKFVLIGPDCDQLKMPPPVVVAAPSKVNDTFTPDDGSRKRFKVSAFALGASAATARVARARRNERIMKRLS
jgi:hypothetical protein